MSNVASVGEAAAEQAAPAPPRRRRGRGSRIRHGLAPVPWLAPAVILIAVVVIWPIVTMVQTSLQHYSSLGILTGSAGTQNFRDLSGDPNLPGILARTVLWVAAVTGVDGAKRTLCPASRLPS